MSPLFILPFARIEVPFEIWIVLVVITAGLWLIPSIFGLFSGRSRSRPLSDHERAVLERETELLVAEKMSGLMAAIISADGKIEKTEIDMAVELVNKILPNGRITASMLRNEASKTWSDTNVKKVAEELRSMLSSDGLVVFFKVLLAVCAADNDIDEREVEIINSIGGLWNINVPTR